MKLELHRVLRGAAVAAFLLALATAGGALDLKGAKAAGQIGEKPDGYIGAVAAKPSAAVSELVGNINGQRRQHYQRIATDTGAPLEAVAAQAGGKLIGKAKKGEFIQRRGKWVKK